MGYYFVDFRRWTPNVNLSEGKKVNENRWRCWKIVSTPNGLNVKKSHAPILTE